MNRVVVGVGSNIRPKENIRKARTKISQTYRLIKESTFVETDPVGIEDQPNFINGAFLIETSLNTEQFKQWLFDLEDKLERDRKGHKYGPRTIDLDIVVWNGEVVDSDLYNRDFLKNAVLEVQPDLDL